MFIHTIETDEYGKDQTKYWLTQGDSCGILSKPIDEDGSLIPYTDIAKCLFKIMTKKFVIIFEKEMTLQNDKYLFYFTPEESATLDIGTYRYEIEYTLTGGGVNTTNSYFFNIIEQGKTPNV